MSSYAQQTKAYAFAVLLVIAVALGFAVAPQGYAQAAGGDLGPAAADLNGQDAVELSDGTYTVAGLNTAVLSMYHFDKDTARVVIKGDDAWLITSIDGTKEESTLNRFNGMAYGKQTEILDPSDETNHTLIAGTPVANVIEIYGDDGVTSVGRTFVLPVPKSIFENGSDIYYMIKYREGYVNSSGVSHDGDWYKAGSGDYYLTGYTLAKESDSTDLPGQPAEPVALEITNNTGMFKAVTASASANADGSAELTFALSGTGYKWLYKGTYEEALAANEAIAAGIDGDAPSGNLVKGETNAEGKLEFKMQVPADEIGEVVPVVAISQSYYNKFKQGQNAQERAYYPRQLVLDLDEATLVTGDYEVTKQIAVTNNVSMFRPAATATLECVGGPNSNNYRADLVLPMTSASLSEAFVGTPAEAEAADSTIAFDTSTAAEGQSGTFTISVKWVETFGDPTTLETLCDGEPFVLSFKSAKNGTWYGRQATLDEAAGTLVFDPWIDPTSVDAIDALGTVEAVQAALTDGSLAATPELAANLIDAIYVQSRDDKTDLYCASAKLVWDALSDEQKEQVEGEDADPDYFGRDTGDASADDPLNQDEIGENEILVVSFGTSFNGSRVATIGGVEKALAAAYPGWSVRRAFTAQIIINHIQARDNEKIDNVDQALERAVANGVKNLVVAPTHLMHGAEYDELKTAIDKYADTMTISYAEPLLGPVGETSTTVNADKEAVAKAVVAAACAEAGYADAAAAAADGAAVVLMGHGTAHDAKVTYQQMQAQMDALGYTNVFVGTVEGEPESTACQNVIAAVKAAGYAKVVLRPLMVVAGDHANNDMADPEDEESWYSQFTAEGNFAAENVSCQIAGLGQIPAVQQIYVEHAAPIIAPQDLEKAQKAVAEAEVKAKAAEDAAAAAAAAADKAEKSGTAEDVAAAAKAAEEAQKAAADAQQAAEDAVVAADNAQKSAELAGDEAAKNEAVKAKAAAVAAVSKAAAAMKAATAAAEKVAAPKANPMKASAKAVKVKAKKVKKKAQTVNAITVTGAQGKLTYKIGKISTKKKLAKQAKKKIKVLANGKIKLGKKLKKGTYKVTVAVTDAGNASYKAATQNVTVKIKVK